jgi:hypothetical protein
MITKEEILNSIQFVVNNSKYVKIKEENIENAINLITNNEKKSWLNSDLLDLNKYSQNQIIMYLILCESLNFCYWDSDIKWKIEYKGEWYSGSFGLFYGISKAIQNGYDLLNIDYLEKMTIEQLDEIFKGTTSIPLLEERYEIIKQLVQELKNIDDLSKALDSNNDIELLNNIINNFSNFNDISIYKGKKVYFFKRAILLVGDLIENVKSIKEKVKNDSNMLGCADYKIPQVLRHLGILEYNEELAQIVDSKQQLKHDSEMEIEVRANMLYALELIKNKLHQKGIEMNSTQIDNILWLLSKNKEFKAKPYHLTRTIYY